MTSDPQQRVERVARVAARPRSTMLQTYATTGEAVLAAALAGFAVRLAVTATHVLATDLFDGVEYVLCTSSDEHDVAFVWRAT